MIATPRAFRLLRPALFALALVVTPGLAVADESNGIFLVDMSDGYGIDTCVATGAACGQAMADAWCRVHDFERAVGFGMVKSDATPAKANGAEVRTAACDGTACQEAVAITCAR